MTLQFFLMIPLMFILTICLIGRLINNTKQNLGIPEDEEPNISFDGETKKKLVAMARIAFSLVILFTIAAIHWATKIEGM